MDLDHFKIDFKIFKIDQNFYEIRDKSYDETVEIIKENHLKKLRHTFKDFDIKVVNPEIISHKEKGFNFRS